MPATKAASAAATAAELEALTSRVAELEAALEAAQSTELRTTVWLSGEYRVGTTSANKTKVAFSCQKSIKTQAGSRAYGQYHNFVAYGEMADEAMALFAAGEKLFTITAFESPWSNNSKRSDWVVTSITAFARPEQQPEAPLPGAPFAEGPTDEEIPF
jgi:hypothetical protein